MRAKHAFQFFFEILPYCDKIRMFLDKNFPLVFNKGIKRS